MVKMFETNGRRDNTVVIIATDYRQKIFATTQTLVLKITTI